MSVKCPRCNSEHVETRDLASKACGAVGAAAGAAAGVAGALNGAKLGARAGVVAGPAGAAVGTVIGAIIGGLFGAAAGASVGAKVGRVIDEKLLNNHHCLICDYTFSQNLLPKQIDGSTQSENP